MSAAIAMEPIPDSHFTTSSSFTSNVYRDVYPSIEPSSPALSQDGKVVVITGASRGIGRRGLATAFAKANAKALVLTARSTASLKETEAAVKATNPAVEVLSLAVETTDDHSVKTAFEQIKSRFGTVDVLVNNAAMLHSDNNPIGSAALDKWWGDFDVNVKGHMLVTKYFLQLLGAEKPGTIVGLASAAGLLVLPGMSGYSISKLASHQLSTYVAVENPNVNVVALHPGILLTDMTTPAFTQFAKDTPELVGGAAVWLATDAARFLSGRYVSANWDVDELVTKREVILDKDLLKLALTGEFVTATLKSA